VQIQVAQYEQLHIRWEICERKRRACLASGIWIDRHDDVAELESSECL
jgi:hypothetical protein